MEAAGPVCEYRAILNLDYDTRCDFDGNNYNRILAALERAGWYYVETSAMAYDGDLDGIRLGLEVLARAVGFPGRPSAITVQVQLMGPPREVPGASSGDLWLPRLLDLPRAPVPPS